MTRILLAWQHGQNFGHWARLSAVARSAATAGAFPILAVPESHAQTLPQSGSTDIVARSPRPQPNVRATQPQSFADVLISLGYAQPETLAPVLHWWLTLLARLKIDRVVLDYAPAAQWAAHCLGIPAMQITNGFDGPPPTCPTFKFDLRGAMLAPGRLGEATDGRAAGNLRRCNHLAGAQRCSGRGPGDCQQVPSRSSAARSG
jgi:hypothetical protein